MSLLKTYRNDIVSRPMGTILDDFRAAAYNGTVGQVTREDVITLVAFYAEYAVAYLDRVAETFEPVKDASETMKFMNSFIAEAVNEAGLHYYNFEKGWSIVDRAVQAALDNGGVALVSDIAAVVAEIEASHEAANEDVPEEE